KEYDRKQRRFQLIFDRDGNFKVEDVPAGTYELRVRVTNPPKDPNMRYQRTEEELGLLVKEVTIPPGAPGEEFDLGNFEMDLKGGIHTRLEGRARFEITEQSGIDTLPLTLVLDAQGRVVARDVEGKRLRSAVDRAIAKASGEQEKS